VAATSKGGCHCPTSSNCCPTAASLLHGRHADLINIAGKRTSLAYLNHQITAIPGVADARLLPARRSRGPTASPG
jgi:hypothetical protein